MINFVKDILVGLVVLIPIGLVFWAVSEIFSFRAIYAVLVCTAIIMVCGAIGNSIRD